MFQVGDKVILTEEAKKEYSIWQFKDYELEVVYILGDTINFKLVLPEDRYTLWRGSVFALPTNKVIHAKPEELVEYEDMI